MTAKTRLKEPQFTITLEDINRAINSDQPGRPHWQDDMDSSQKQLLLQHLQEALELLKAYATTPRFDRGRRANLRVMYEKVWGQIESFKSSPREGNE